jgi:sugar/nucleoside kinase (ribokinase family)
VTFVSVGNVVADLTIELPALPGPGDDVTATSSGVSAGGSFNALVAAARQGIPSAYGGAHGRGPFGDIVRAALQAEGIAFGELEVPDLDTGWDVAITDATGERTFLTTVGAEARLDSGALALLALDAGDVLHVSGYSFARTPSASALAAWVPDVPANVTVIVDPGPLGSEIPDAVRARADWWSAAEGETVGDPRRGSIVRLGRHGCELDGERLPGFAVDAIDTNGAGDTHVGVFAASIALGFDPRTAAIRANAAAAIAVTRRGPATAPTRDELEQFLGAHSG